MAVQHANALEEAEALRRNIASRFDCRELYTTDLNPVIGTQTGPGTLALAFYTEE